MNFKMQFVFTDFLVVNLPRTVLTMNIIIYRRLEFVTSEQQNTAKANISVCYVYVCL